LVWLFFFELVSDNVKIIRLLLFRWIRWHCFLSDDVGAVVDDFISLIGLVFIFNDFLLQIGVF